MKNFLRCLLIVMCVLWGYGSVAASSQTDTINVCYKTGTHIYADVVETSFRAFLEDENMRVHNYLGRDGVQVEYKDFQLEFSGDGLEGKKSYTDFKSQIGVATDDLYNQYIRCTIAYNRIIRFGDEALQDYDSENVIPESELSGEPTGDYPEFVLNSRREWHTVVCIGKWSNRQFQSSITGATCLDNAVTLSVPATFRDMKVEWFCGGRKIPDADTWQISFSKKYFPANTLAAYVHCNVKTCLDKVLAEDSIKIRLNQTPASTLTSDNCLPTSSKFIRVTAHNDIPGVEFLWNGEPLTPIRPLSANSQTVDYPVQGSDKLTITLTTTGGCKSSQTKRIVYRKLSSNVVLRVLDSCPTAGIPFAIEMVPSIPFTPVQWILPVGFKELMFPTETVKRTDKILVIKNSKTTFPETITVTDSRCGGSISTSITVSEAYTEMMAIDDNGKILQSGDTVDAGVKEITFTAPQHSSITGDNPYTWSIWRYSGTLGSTSTPREGPATITTSAPSGTLYVRVSYTSCRGSETKEYQLYSR